MVGSVMEYLYQGYDRDRQRHIECRCCGTVWIEKVVLINRDGFSKDWEVHPEDRHVQHRRNIHIGALEIEEMGKCYVEGVMIFLRTNEKAPDGRAIFREDVGL
jgi:hypothetical protein